jgi:hypothetical protein
MNKVWWKKCGTRLLWTIQTWIWGKWANLTFKYLKTYIFNLILFFSNFCSWASNSMEDQSNDYERNGPTLSGSSSTADPQLQMLMPMQKMPITQNQVIYCIEKTINL